MKITIEMDNGQTMVVERDGALLRQLVERYPEVSMMRAMEECNELAIAISKGVVNGKPKKIANLGEEIVDVMEAIMKAITRFDLSAKDLEPWEEEKRARFEEREKTDENVFRKAEAKKHYWDHSFDPKRTWGFTRDSTGSYRFIGLTDSAEISKLAGGFFRKLGTTRGALVNNGLSSSILHLPDIRVLQKIEDIMSPVPFDPEVVEPSTPEVKPEQPVAEIIRRVTALREVAMEKTASVWEWWNERLGLVPKNKDGTLDSEEYLKAVDEFEERLKAAIAEPQSSERAAQIGDLATKIEEDS